jgi:hypothetical protein
MTPVLTWFLHSRRCFYRCLSLVVILQAGASCGTSETRPGIVDSSSADGVSVEGSVDVGAIYIADGPIPGWVGGVCTSNADCTNSPAAVENSWYGCLNEVYCLAGLCHGDCTIECELVRIDINPCPAPRICMTLPGSGSTSICKITPIPCVTAETCPLNKPILADGGQGDWSCVDGICVYPEFEYPTQ